MPAFQHDGVKAAFDALPAAVRPCLLKLRNLIHQTAKQHATDVGALEETLKWGQPSWLTPETGAGTTIRLGIDKQHPGKAALFVHCQTSLISSFREQYPHLDYDGSRAILLDPELPLPESELGTASPWR